MVYASISEGFRSGGFNTQGSPSYEPESIRNYEIGTKFAMADGRVNFEGAAFFTKYNDMVRRGLIQIGTTLDSLLSNIGEAEIKGVEAGITLQPAQGFTLSANAAWLNAEVTALESDGAPEDRVNFEGDSLDYIPKFSYSLGANYAFQLGADLPAFVRIDFNHRDKVEYTDRSSFPAAEPAAVLRHLQSAQPACRVRSEILPLSRCSRRTWPTPTSRSTPTAPGPTPIARGRASLA